MVSINCDWRTWGGANIIAPLWRETGEPGEEKHTLKWGETTAQDQLEITKLALGEDDGGESLGLSSKLVVSWSIAGEEVLQDPTMWRVGHYEQ